MTAKPNSKTSSEVARETAPAPEKYSSIPVDGGWETSHTGHLIRADLKVSISRELAEYFQRDWRMLSTIGLPNPDTGEFEQISRVTGNLRYELTRLWAEYLSYEIPGPEDPKEQEREILLLFFKHGVERIWVQDADGRTYFFCLYRGIKCVDLVLELMREPWRIMSLVENLEIRTQRTILPTANCLQVVAEYEELRRQPTSEMPPEQFIVKRHPEWFYKVGTTNLSLADRRLELEAYAADWKHVTVEIRSPKLSAKPNEIEVSLEEKKMIPDFRFILNTDEYEPSFFSYADWGFEWQDMFAAFDIHNTVNGGAPWSNSTGAFKKRRTRFYKKLKGLLPNAKKGPAHKAFYGGRNASGGPSFKIKHSILRAS